MKTTAAALKVGQVILTRNGASSYSDGWGRTYPVLAVKTLPDGRVEVTVSDPRRKTPIVETLKPTATVRIIG